jgi:hypothetical protein
VALAVQRKSTDTHKQARTQGKSTDEQMASSIVMKQNQEIHGKIRR